MQQAATHFAAEGSSHADAQHQANGWLGQLLQDQSALLCYIDVFWLFTVAMALTDSPRIAFAAAR